MALKLKYTDEHGIVHINMSPKSSPREEEIQDPKFDTINNRFGSYDLFGGKYDEGCSYEKNDANRNLFTDKQSEFVESKKFSSEPETYDLFGGDQPSLFRSRYNSIEEELANTPYAFATERSLRSANKLDITIDRVEASPSKDIENNRFFNRKLSLEYDDLFTRGTVDTPAFTVTQLIHAQDRYFDLSSRQSVPPDRQTVSERVSGYRTPVTVDEAFTVLNLNSDLKTEPTVPVVPAPKRKREKSFAILTEAPSSRPTSPRSLPVDIRQARVSPFRGRGFREETSRHNTPSTSTATSRNSSPRRRTSSLSRIDKMAAATLPAPLPTILLPRPHSPRDFLRENIQEVRELSELNREKHAAEAEIQRREEEEALLREMELQEKISKSLGGSRANSRSNSRVNSRSNSRTNSRSNSPSKINLRSRSNSPASKAAKTHVMKSSLTKDVKVNKPFINKNDGMAKPAAHRSRITSRSVSKSQPQSNDGSPKHSKIPKRQSSVSPVRTTRKVYIPRRPVENNLNNQRFISSSTSSIHETIRVGSQIHDKRNMSQSSQNLSISPKHIKGKPPISPGRGGPPPSNRFINAKRLSPIVGTPNKSPVEDLKPSSSMTSLKPTTAKKPVKAPVNTSNRLISRQPSRATSRDTSPEKRKIAKTPVTKPSTVPSKPITRTPSNKSLIKPVSGKPEARKPISRTDSVKSLTRTPSTKNFAEKPPLKKMGSKTSLTNKSNNKINDTEKPTKRDEKDGKKENNKKETTDSSTDPEKNLSQDNETQYDKITNDKGELVIMTKKSIVSMTTAAITSQPLEIVTTVTNQLPTTLEKAREKGIFERLGSKDSLTGKDEGQKKDELKGDAKIVDEKKKEEKRKPLFTDDHKLKPLQGPFNDPQLEKVRQKIDDILKTPEISRENILTPSAKARTKPKIEEKDKEKDDQKKKLEKPAEVKEIQEPKQKEEKSEAQQIRTEAAKIIESIITPVEEPKPEPPKTEMKLEKKAIEPIITVVNEKKNAKVEKKDSAGVEKVNTTLVKGEPEVEVQSSNVSTPGIERIMEKENGSDKSQSNGGFPQSTSTTPKPPARTKKEQKDKENSSKTPENESNPENGDKKPNICSRLMGKCKSKCCPCCVQGEADDEKETEEVEDLTPKEKQGMMSKFSCCKKKKIEEEVEREIERAAGKGATIEFEDETKRKRKLRDIICCGRGRRVGDAGVPVQRVGDVTMSPRDLSMEPGVVQDAGCCGKRRGADRRDSILSDRPPPNCCNRLMTWARGVCRRREPPASRRASMFSKNKSLSPTLPPEDTRKKLDPSLIEHMNLIRAAVPVLPIVLAYFCLICNVVIPGLGSIFSGIFCLCFGIPRFGPNDGAKYRIGSFVVNLVVGLLQLFTVLFCLVGWGWSIWWGVLMLKLSRKYRKLRAEAKAAEAEAPPVTATNHTRS